MTTPLPRVTSVRVVRDRVLHLRFDDGVEGDVDFAPRLQAPVFDDIRDNDERFAEVYVDEGGTVNWPPGNLDFAEEVLHDDILAAQAHPAHH
jgi:hypothetical protein